MSNQTEQQKLWAKIVAKAWADEEYKQKLLTDPAAVLSAEGVALPEGVNFKCVEATDKQAWFVLPPKPADGGQGVELGERIAPDFCCFCCG